MNTPKAVNSGSGSELDALSMKPSTAENRGNQTSDAHQKIKLANPGEFEPIFPRL